MVQIGETFNRFQRVVRDVGLELGKNIELVITGAETELDKTLIEKDRRPVDASGAQRDRSRHRTSRKNAWHQANRPMARYASMLITIPAASRLKYPTTAPA